MLGFRSQFAAPLVAASVAAVVTLVVAGALLVRGRGRRPAATRAALRVLVTGAALVVVIATASPDTWPPQLRADGDLVLRPGGGGLADWRVLLRDPGSLAAVLLLANVLLYVPLGLLGRLLWRRSAAVVGATAVLSVAVELLQWRLLGRVASTDDVLLNVAGSAVGTGLAVVAEAAGRRWFVVSDGPAC